MLVRLDESKGNLSRERWVNPEEVAALEDVDPGPPYHSGGITRTRITLACGETLSSQLSISQIVDRFTEAQERTSLRHEG